MPLVEERGLFWWDDEPLPPKHFASEASVAGVLTIDERGRATVELDGRLVDPANPHPFAILDQNPELEKKCIRGLLKVSGNQVLLSDIYRSGGRFSSNQISFDKWSSTNCLVGEGRLPENEPALNAITSLSITPDGLEEWMGLGSITLQYSDPNLNIAYSKPDNVVHHDGGRCLKINYRCDHPLWVRRVDRLNMREIASLQFEEGVPVGLKEVKREYGTITDFVKLLSGSRSDLPFPTVKWADNSHIATLYFTRHRNEFENFNIREMWVSYPAVKESFGKLFFSYRKKRLQFGPGFYLYLGTLRGMNMYAEHMFINLIWGLEAFHREKYGSGNTSAAMAAKITRILDTVTRRGDKRWLTDRLEHLSEPSLSERLNAVFKLIPLDFEQASVKSFCVECSQIRNRVSHFGGHKSDDESKQFLIRISILTNALGYLYHAALLSEIGLETNLLRQAVSDSLMSFHFSMALKQAGLVLRNATPD